jgi:hypothetical protein
MGKYRPRSDPETLVGIEGSCCRGRDELWLVPDACRTEALLRRSKIFIDIGSESATSSVGAAYRRASRNKPEDRSDGASEELRAISSRHIL